MHSLQTVQSTVQINVCNQLYTKWDNKQYFVTKFLIVYLKTSFTVSVKQNGCRINNNNNRRKAFKLCLCILSEFVFKAIILAQKGPFLKICQNK